MDTNLYAYGRYIINCAKSLDPELEVDCANALDYAEHKSHYLQFHSDYQIGGRSYRVILDVRVLLRQDGGGHDGLSQLNGRAGQVGDQELSSRVEPCRKELQREGIQLINFQSNKLNMNKVVHFEIPADDTDRAQKFYKEMFDWKIDPVPNMPYFMIYTVGVDEKNMPKEAGAINGGLYKREPGDQPIIVIDVPSIDEYIEKAKKLGSKVVVPKTDVMDMGFYAKITDSEGNVIGIWQNKIKQ